MGRADRNEFRAGAIALATITALSVSAMLIPRAFAERTITYSLRATPELNLDLTGLVPGSPVRVGGLTRGVVLAVDSELSASHQVGAIVTFKLSSNPPIYPDARARIVRNVISQQGEIDFVSTGSPKQLAKPLPSGFIMTFESEESEDSDGMGVFSRSTRTAIDEIYERFQVARTTWPEVKNDASRRFDELSKSMNAIQVDVNATWPDLRDRASDLIDQFRALESALIRLKNEAQAAKREIDAISSIRDDGGPWWRTKQAFAELADSWALLGDDATSITDTTTRIRAASARVRDDSNRLLQTLRLLAESFGVADITADLVIAAGQFDKLYSEIFLTPWRALIPNESSIEKQRGALDDVSRVMLRGAEEARAAQFALQALLDSGAIAGSAATEMLDQLNRMLDEVREIEEALWRERSRNFAQ